MKTPELSIVVPVYNVDRWLNECLNSIQRQTFTSWECILVDDGSTDFSGIICDSYAKNDARFRVIHQENAGVSAARNTGIEAATAPLLSFIDPDDFISYDFYEILVRELRDSNADIVGSAIRIVDEAGKEDSTSICIYLLSNHVGNKMLKMTCNDEIQDAICRGIFSCDSWGKIFTRSLWGDTRFPVGIDLGEDVMTVLQVIIRADRGSCRYDAKYIYRTRKKSLQHGTVTRERFLQELWTSSQMVEQLSQHSPSRKTEFLNLKMQYDLSALSNFLQSNPEMKRKSSALRLLKDAYDEVRKN